MGRLRNAAWRMRDFFRRDAVLAIACVLAAASCMAVPPDAGYAAYIDWRTIGLLFPYGCHIGPGARWRAGTGVPRVGSRMQQRRRAYRGARGAYVFREHGGY